MSRTSICEALVIAAAFVIGGPSLLAQHAGHGRQDGNQGGQISRPSDPYRTDRTGRMDGRLVSQSEDSITIETVRGGEPVRFTYGLDDRTELRGTVRVGSQVSITYVERGGIRSATKVEGQRRRRGC